MNKYTLVKKLNQLVCKFSLLAFPCLMKCDNGGGAAFYFSYGPPRGIKCRWQMSLDRYFFDHSIHIYELDMDDLLTSKLYKSCKNILISGKRSPPRW
jgi:hypothetical protein